jgi:hypothetical protein
MSIKQREFGSVSSKKLIFLMESVELMLAMVSREQMSLGVTMREHPMQVSRTSLPWMR